jgi:hypothetical protein
MIIEGKRLRCSADHCPLTILVRQTTLASGWLAIHLVTDINRATHCSGTVALCPTHIGLTGYFNTGIALIKLGQTPDKGVSKVRIWQCDASGCSATIEQVLDGTQNQSNPEGWLKMNPSNECFCPRHQDHATSS